jgi:hypothetical protein
MQEYDVFGEIHGCFFMKSKGENRQDAVQKLRMKIHDFNIDPMRFMIPTDDGENHKAELEDWNVEFSQEPLEGELEENEKNGYD